MGVRTSLSVELADGTDHITVTLRAGTYDELDGEVVELGSSSGPVFASLADLDAFADALKEFVARHAEDGED